MSEPGDPWNGLPFVPGGGEFDLMRSAASAGVPVPHVRYRLAAEDGLGEGAITDRIAGETLGKRIVHGAEFAAARPGWPPVLVRSPRRSIAWTRPPRAACRPWRRPAISSSTVRRSTACRHVIRRSSSPIAGPPIMCPLRADCRSSMATFAWAT